MSYQADDELLARARAMFAEAKGSRRNARTLPIDAMERCKKCLRRGCPNVHACCGGKVNLNIRVPCPDGLWNMVPATT